MKTTNLRVARLKEMIALEEKRETLHDQFIAINERLVAIQKELYGASASHAPVAAAAPRKLAKAGRKGRGQLKGQILEILQAAGSAGVRVKDLADRLGVKASNVHSWFQANIKKMSGLKKVGAGRYAFKGVVEKPVKKGKPAKKTKGRAKRGAMKKQILNALKKAGDKGVTIKDLAAELKADYKRIYIWFATTGKKIAGIKKAGPAQFKLEA